MACVWCDTLNEGIFSWKCPMADKRTKKFVRDTVKDCWWSFSDALVVLNKNWINPCIHCLRKVLELDKN